MCTEDEEGDGTKDGSGRGLGVGCAWAGYGLGMGSLENISELVTTNLTSKNKKNKLFTLKKLLRVK